MRMRGNKPNRSGIVLIEVMLYGTVFILIVGVGLHAFWNFQMRSLALTRNAHDIARALHAGEQWRAEVRAAEEAEVNGRGELTLRTGESVILYRFSENTVWRRKGEGTWAPFLNEVKSSELTEEQRAYTKVWKWELELASRQKTVDVRPLFTFLATQREVAR